MKKAIVILACAALSGHALAVDPKAGTWYHLGTAIENGGFEEWGEEIAKNPKGLVVAASDGAPFSWNVVRESGKAAASVSKDSAIKHGGKASARINVEESGEADDSVGLGQHFSVEPSSCYTVRVWVRGENIISATGKPGGILIWANSGPAGDEFYGNQKSMAKHPDPATGTLDWQLLEFPVETGKNAERLGITLQLRWASGTVWFDDVEVVKREALTPVKSY